MAKWCPAIGETVTYLHCLDCDEKACRNEDTVQRNGEERKWTNMPDVNNSKLFAVVMKHGENDFEVWQPDLSEGRLETLSSTIRAFGKDNGCSIRGTLLNIAREISTMEAYVETSEEGEPI